MSDLSTSLMRVLDANANRAREGIRTAEDYLRYGLNESRWSSRLKSTRALISQSLRASFGDQLLLSARDAGADPLSPENAADFLPKPGAQPELPRDVAQRGLKRAQEALRVLEEYLRVANPDISATFSRSRYELYQAEQWLMHAGTAAETLTNATVYVILTPEQCPKGIMKTAEATLKGGARLLQLRCKNARSDKELVNQAHDLLKLCRSFQAVLFCNDRTDVAMASGVDGVHLGQDDINSLDARRLVGEKLLIGRSTHSLTQFKEALADGRADYLAIGAMYETCTKSEPVLAGLELAREVSALHVQLPVFAIGGISPSRIPELKATGVSRIAVATAITRADDPESATRTLIQAMQN